MDSVLALWPAAPWLQAGVIALVLTVLTWLLSVFTREYSWVDRLWSVAPPLYVTWVAAAEGFADPRLDLMAALVVLWGARLTFNFARKGGYAPGGEDYRWAVLRARMKPWQFQVFNATFISPYQMGLVFLFTSPAHAAWTGRGTPLGWLDAVAAAAFLALLAVETVADEQMWAFQQDKKARQARSQAPVRGFFDQGLYAWSRHPNYFGELGQWWVFVLFGVAATGQWLTWTWLGPVILTALFAGSIRFTESLSLSKYPDYAEYQRSTPVLLPRPPRRPRA